MSKLNWEKLKRTRESAREAAQEQSWRPRGWRGNSSGNFTRWHARPGEPATLTVVWQRDDGKWKVKLHGKWRQELFDHPGDARAFADKQAGQPNDNKKEQFIRWWKSVQPRITS